MLRPPSSVLGTAPWRAALLLLRRPAVRGGCLFCRDGFEGHIRKLADGELTERAP